MIGKRMEARCGKAKFSKRGKRSYRFRRILSINSRKHSKASPAILITHGHRVSPLGHKTLYNFANKKVSTIQPPLSRGRFESISARSRLDRAAPIEEFRRNEGRILRILRHGVHVVIGQVSAKGAGTLWQGET